MSQSDYLRPDGYRMILAKDHPFADMKGYVREHRLVMESSIGRILDPKEVVHHIDGDRSNNSIENLKLYASNAEHLSDAHGVKIPDQEKYIALYESGMSARDIGKEVGVDHHAVIKNIRKSGVKTRTKEESVRNPKMPQDDEIREMLKTMTFSEIADKIGMGLMHVKAYAKYHGIKSPRTGGVRKEKQRVLPSREILFEMRQRMTTRQMAEEIGMPYYTLSTYLSDHKIHKQKQAQPNHATPDSQKPIYLPEKQLGVLESHKQLLHSTELP